MKTTKNFLPFAYILAVVAIVAMVGLTIWQFTLPEKNPTTIMGILCGGGLVAAFAVAFHKMNHSREPFSAGALPMGIALLWVALVFAGCGIWQAIQDNSVFTGIIMSGVASLLAFFGYQTLRK